MPELSAPLVGMRFRPPALTILQGLGMDQKLILRREPENQYDPNAIAVDMPENWQEALPELAEEARTEAQSLGLELPSTPQLGYIRAVEAKDWAPILDQLSSEDIPFPRSRLTFSSSGSPQVTIEVEDSDAEG